MARDLTDILYDMSMDSSQDEECGDVSECGFWAARFDNLKLGGTHFSVKYAILIEDDQGFKSSEEFTNKADCMARWSELEALTMPNWQVVVGNIGTVYDGTDEEEARKTYAEYVTQSESGKGRAGNETVTLMRGEEIEEEHNATE